MRSPGHRANILAPAHTHVGVGIAYNAAAGYVSIAQEFVNHYVNIEPLPSSASVGATLTVRGRLLPGSRAPVLNLAYEPIPPPLSLAALAQTGTYQSPAQNYAVPPISLTGDGSFSAAVLLDAGGRAGFYHIRLWVQHPVQSDPIPAVNLLVETR